MLIPEIEIDAEIDFNDITKKFVRLLKDFEPFRQEILNQYSIQKMFMMCGRIYKNHR